MKKHLLLFALLLLSWTIRAQSIEVSADHLSFEYAEGHSSVPQSLIISVSDLTDDLLIQFEGFQSAKFEVSLEEENGFVNSLSIPLGEFGNETEIFVRMKEGLAPDSYQNTIQITSTGVNSVDVLCTGTVNGAVALPSFTPSSGTFHGQQTVTINCQTEDANIYYTTNGEDPDESSTIYESEILIDKTTTLKAIGIKDGWNNSEIASALYTIQYHIHAEVSPLGSGEIIYDGQYWAYLDKDIDSNVGSITLQATPKTNYSFLNWEVEDNTLTNPYCEILVNNDHNMVANFELMNGNIQFSVVPENAGSIVFGGSQVIGQIATLTAIPENCYHFKQWDNGITTNPLVFTVGEGINNYTAIFELNNYSIIGNSNNNEFGSVTGGGDNYHCEETAELMAIPNEGFEFTRWDDGSTDNPRRIEVIGNASFTAIFDAKSTTINVIADPAEGGNVSGGGTYHGGDVCMVSAQTNEGYSFINWTEDDNIVSTNPTYSFTIEPSYWNNNRTLVAHFVQIPVIEIEPIQPICDGEALELIAPSIPDNYNGKWEISFDTSFTTPETYTDGQELRSRHNGWSLRFLAFNESDTISSNIETITVHSDIDENEIRPIEAKKHTDSTAYILIYPNLNDKDYKYQWYKADENGNYSPIENATKQYYYNPEGLADGEYKVYFGFQENERGELICGAFSEPYRVNNNSLQLVLYPNPSHNCNNVVVVNSCEGPAQLTIYSTDGRLLHTQTVSGSQATIGINLPQGIYVAYLTDGSGYTKVGKIIIQ